MIHRLDIVNIGKDKHDDYSFTALDKDVFLPLGVYAVENGKPIILDSGCTLAVAPYASDIVGRI